MRSSPQQSSGASSPVSERALRVTAAQAAAFRLQRQHLAADRPGKAFPPSLARPSELRRTSALASPSIVDVVRDAAGIQAQVQSAAEMAIWTRRRQTKRDDVRRALWETRELVKTSAMRLTLHVIPAADLAIYIEAMRPTSRAVLARWQGRLKITATHVRLMIETVLDALADGSLPQQELVARAKRRAPKGMRAWLDHAWSAVRPAVVEGAIVYGPPRGAEATFVRVDRWLGRQPEITVDAARAELLRRFLRAFGPATAHDFAKWSGMRVTDTRTAMAALAPELTPVSVDGGAGWILSADDGLLTRGKLDADAIRLLGPFDSFLLAHATTEHLVDARFYKRVYRAQGWISAVVLRGSTIVGTWTQTREGKGFTIGVELFRREPAAVRRAIEDEVAALSAFFGAAAAARVVSI
jgi:uncharacterized protein YcaQ